MNIEDIVIGKEYEYKSPCYKAVLVVVVYKFNGKIICVDLESGHPFCAPTEWLSPRPPYADFVIDEPVMVKDKCTPIWIPRYFAGVTSGGKPITYYGGCTSWTARGEIKSWDECRRPTEEELQEMKGGA